MRLYFCCWMLLLSSSLGLGLGLGSHLVSGCLVVSIYTTLRCHCHSPLLFHYLGHYCMTRCWLEWLIVSDVDQRSSEFPPTRHVGSAPLHRRRHAAVACEAPQFRHRVERVKGCRRSARCHDDRFSSAVNNSTRAKDVRSASAGRCCRLVLSTRLRSAETVCLPIQFQHFQLACGDGAIKV